MLYALKPEPALSLRSTVTALMLLISCCLLLRACLAAQVGGDYEDYEYEVEVDVSKLRKNVGSRLVNARATAASEYQFVGAFFLSSSAHLKSSTCTAAMITQDVALRSIQISQISAPQRSKFENVFENISVPSTVFTLRSRFPLRSA